MVICQEGGADLHTAQLMPLPLTVSCFSKIQIGFTFLVLAHPGSPGKKAVKRGVYLLPYLSFPLRTDPLRFQAGCRKSRLNLALFFVSILCCSTILLIGECMLLLCWFSFFHTKPRDWPGETSLK